VAAPRPHTLDLTGGQRCRRLDGRTVQLSMIACKHGAKVKEMALRGTRSSRMSGNLRIHGAPMDLGTVARQQAEEGEPK
jgi:hypothetical protein